MNKKKFRSSIGGQAVLEGVMMMGERTMATAVRDENGKIQVESKRIKPNREKSFLRRIPFIRGCFNFVSSMFMGVGILLRSSEVYEGEVEAGKFEKWCASKLKINLMSVIMGLAVILGLGLSISLFFVLPSFIIKGVEMLVQPYQMHYMIYNVLEGVIRLLIFVGYIALTTLMKDIRRTYMYHGAEHKTISCYEHGLELNVENVQKQSTIHDRCGTTFMFLVMVVSVLLFSLANVGEIGFWGKLGVKLALLPLVAGVSYEILKFLARFDNWFVKIIKAPGLLLQKLTTKQPTDEMVEVAIVAFNTVLAMDKDLEIAESKFDTKMMLSKAKEELNKTLGNLGEGNADLDWIICEVLEIKRSEIDGVIHIRNSQFDKMMDMVKRRAKGEPLQYILGADFYGLKLDVNSDVLIPRPETEYLVESAVKIINNGDIYKVLDLCTGSGAIAIAIKYLVDVKNTTNKIDVYASDISPKALEIAKRNAERCKTDIKFFKSDLLDLIEEKFDIIISNPPYIKSDEINNLDNNVKNNDPIIALDGGVDGLDFYRKIIRNAPNRLNIGGYIVFEVGINQISSVIELLKVNFMDIKVSKDLEGIERIVMAKVVK